MNIVKRFVGAFLALSLILTASACTNEGDEDIQPESTSFSSVIPDDPDNPEETVLPTVNVEEAARYEFNGHLYSIFDAQGMRWGEINTFCDDKGAHLAVITSDEENDFLFNLMLEHGYDSALFGLHRYPAQTTWNWVTDETSEYTNWAEREPNNSTGEEYYAMFYPTYENGEWNDGDSSDIRAFICEWESERGYEIEVPYVFDGHSYTIYSFEDLSWENINDFCNQQGGHLATIDSDTENQFIFDIVLHSGTYRAFFGLYRDPDNLTEWNWVTGEPFNYDNWAEGEPNNEGGNEFYGMYYADYGEPFYDGQWNDGSIGETSTFVCEWE